MRYTEGLRVLHVDSEVLAGPAGLMLYRGSIKAWKAPHERELIDDAKRDAIVANIRAAFRFRGFDIQVV
ncbi:MAG: Imm74 family immunity protein [Planctomycetota bacterium]